MFPVWSTSYICRHLISPVIYWSNKIVDPNLNAKLLYRESWLLYWEFLCHEQFFLYFTGKTIADVIKIYQEQNTAKHRTLGYTTFYIKKKRKTPFITTLSFRSRSQCSIQFWILLVMLYEHILLNSPLWHTLLNGFWKSRDITSTDSSWSYSLKNVVKKSSKLVKPERLRWKPYCELYINLLSLRYFTILPRKVVSNNLQTIEVGLIDR